MHENVLDYCIKNKTKLIHISTTSVYGKQANIVSENDSTYLIPITLCRYKTN